ncbi:iron ABC transporter permease [Psychrobium sp. 1_MG-2023]|uniref:ABC transporter permease n=1 Tax=Psychrobium sp. 1_MG-2023 TaxID=3062624 RepID=UPI0027352605|nr:iron ABC transporter permease [Psychrobium sp. 1_MG-2023]MDP2560731.1 iron ABC transporter permease [Psychrobium sp. 1_MG-2023]
MFIQLNKKWPAFSWLLSLLIFMPLMAIVWQSFGDDQAVFSHLWQTVLPQYLINTFLVVFGVAFLSMLIGVPLAWLVAMCQFPMRGVFVWALLLPLAMPSYVVAFIYTDLLEYAGPIQSSLRELFGWKNAQDYWFFDVRTVNGAIVMLTLVLFPYVFLLARTSFLEQSQSLLQSARMLGCSAWQSFYRVSLPLARPAIAVSVALVAMETLADFAVVHYFAVPTLTTAVYDTWVGYGSLAAAARLSALMLACLFVLISLERFGRSQQKNYQRTTGQEQINRYQLTGVKAYAATGLCISIFMLAFGLPFILLIDMAIDYFEQSWNDEFIQYSINSFSLAVIVSFICVAIGILLSFFKRLSQHKSSSVPSKIASSGYALPGTVLAIGVLIPLSLFDHAINDLWEYFGKEGPGLILSGTLFAIVAGYVVRFSAIAIGSVESSLNKVTPSIDMVSVTLGMSPLKMLFKVHLPLVRKGCFAAALLVFIESMKELPAALLLRPFDYETLATYVYQFVSDEQLEHGALAAIVIVLVGLIPLIFLNRSLEKAQ